MSGQLSYQSSRDILPMMSTVQEIEQAIRQLSPQERADLRTRLAELDADDWDRQFEADVTTGRLNRLAEEARQDLKSERCTER